MRDDRPRCESVNGGLRCALRVHDLGNHLAFVPEGDPAARIEWWSREDASPGPGAPPAVEGSPVVYVGGAVVPTKPTPTLAPARVARPSVSRSPSAAARREAAAARGAGYTGEACTICGSLRVVRTGTCSTCQSCGSTTSCG